MPSAAIQTPSFQTGFARSAGESRYPHLWRGLVGAWCPSLGPTGNVLHDWSGRWNRGALTNMDPATDWVVSGQQYALDLDGSNDYINCGSAAPLNLTRMTIAAWLKSSGSSGEPAIIGKGSYSGSGYHLVHSGGGGNVNGIYFHLQGNFVLSTSTLNDSLWHFIAASYDGATMRLYWDGVLENSSAVSATASASGTNFEMGRRPGSSPYYAGQIAEAMVFDRPLSRGAIRQLAQRRGILYEPREAVSVKSPVRIASASLTQDANTVAASGTVLIAAASSLTQAGNTLTAAALAEIAATASLTQAANSLTAEAGVVVAGSASLQQASQTVAAEAAAIVGAAAGLTQDQNTLAAAGTLPIAAAASLAQDDQTLSASAGGLNASADLTQEANTLSAAAGVVVGASASLAQADNSLTASAAAEVSAAASITQDGQTLTATGTTGTSARSPFASRIFASRIFGGSRG